MEKQIITEFKSRLVWDINNAMYKKQDVGNLSEKLNVSAPTLFRTLTLYPDHVLDGITQAIINKNGNQGLQKLEALIMEIGENAIISLLQDMVINIKDEAQYIGNILGLSGPVIYSITANDPASIYVGLLDTIHLKTGKAGLIKFRQTMEDMGYNDILNIINNSKAKSLFE
ncbi:Hypothetical protein ORPV_1164 [Orpheovirus IHUMI-LCC2]|uniref:Uncharacterized protein n=1 Tax=Orpheovirus IHUMI-LCC2 TaxID=2023057 RepID=A0A2I2L691_9VIRU|nr:Hypothetical protein ORPV_1164 [Orpheovirus IHUMI-LCC2]SNW63068.1 Hypothetical protein ORPV_1164 [Orpheovirus IHUMI-LCC2]